MGLGCGTPTIFMPTADTRTAQGKTITPAFMGLGLVLYGSWSYLGKKYPNPDFPIYLLIHALTEICVL